MSLPLPLRLGRQPLLESLFEVRFKSSGNPVTDLLPGIIFSKLGKDYRKSEILPLATLPKELRDRDPNLQFAATQRLSGPEAVVYFGDQVVGLSKTMPYRGWEDFRQRIFDLVAVIRESGIISEIDRYALKAVNVIPQTRERQLDHLALNVTIAGKSAVDSGFHLRTELNDSDYLRIVEITPNITAKTANGAVHSGLRVAIDCIRPCPSTHDGWTDLVAGLDDLHHEEKRLFFELITPETLAYLQPEYM